MCRSRRRADGFDALRRGPARRRGARPQRHPAVQGEALALRRRGQRPGAARAGGGQPADVRGRRHDHAPTTPTASACWRAFAAQAPGFDPRPGRSVVLGAGGAARGAAAALLDAGAPEVRMVNRTLDRAEALAGALGAGSRAFAWADAAAAFDGAAAVVNATSAGLGGDGALDLPLDAAAGRRGGHGHGLQAAARRRSCAGAQARGPPHRRRPGHADRPGASRRSRPSSASRRRRTWTCAPWRWRRWERGMILLGLTGSIGMGKSTTAAMFAEAGVPVYDADAAVHGLYATGGAAVGPVERGLSRAWSRTARSTARRCASAVLGDPEALARLEAIVHPLVGRDRAAFFDAGRGATAPTWSCSTSRCCSRPAATPTSTPWWWSPRPADDAARAGAGPAGHDARSGSTPSWPARCPTPRSAPAPTSWSTPARAWSRRASRCGGSSRRCAIPAVAGRDARRLERSARSGAIDGPWRARSSSTPKPPASTRDRPPAGRDRLRGDRGLPADRAHLPPLHRPRPRHRRPRPSGCTACPRAFLKRQAAVRRPEVGRGLPGVRRRRAADRPQRRLRPRLHQPRAGAVRPRAAARGRAGSTPWRWPRSAFPGMHNSLDALCKRFKISLAEREKHGALIDARLLADGLSGAEGRPRARAGPDAGGAGDRRGAGQGGGLRRAAPAAGAALHRGRARRPRRLRPRAR